MPVSPALATAAELFRALDRPAVGFPVALVVVVAAGASPVVAAADRTAVAEAPAADTVNPVQSKGKKAGEVKT
jgi:hypothetical protein